MSTDYFRPALDFCPTKTEWGQLFDCREGRIHPSKVSERCRRFADVEMSRVLREAVYQDAKQHGRSISPEPDYDVGHQFFSLMDPERVRSGGFSGGNAVAAFQNRLNTWTMDGFAELQDSLDGVTETVEITNYLPAPVVQAQDMHTLRPLPKGGTAEHAELIVLDFGQWRLVRLAKRARIDEQDLVNDIPGSIRKNLAQLGRAAKRAWLDLAWSTILSNPALDQDGYALFEDIHHINTSSAGLSDTAIGAASSAIHRQVIMTPESDGGVQFQHMNLKPRYLVIPPELETTARKWLRLMKLDDSEIDLELRIESRMTDIPCRNPLTGATIAGTATNWLLTADNSVAPWLLKGILSGGDRPRIRSSALNPADNPGEYGLQIDVSWGIACKAADFRGAYWSSGA